MKRIIHLLKIGDIDQEILIELEKNLTKVFKNYGMRVEILPEIIALEDIDFNFKRRQYDASRILDNINKFILNKHYFRILGIMDKDIYTKNHNFIFGTTRLLSKCALISIIRLRESFYIELGLTHRKNKNKTDFDINVLKEAIHELGHTFGLEHCVNYCVMQFSNCLADTDNKPTKFCSSCLEKLNLVNTRII